MWEGLLTWSYILSSLSSLEERSVRPTMHMSTRKGATLAITLSLALATGLAGMFCEGIAPYPAPPILFSCA